MTNALRMVASHTLKATISTAHIELITHPDFEQYKGVAFKKDKRELIEISPIESLDADVIALGGVGFDNIPSMGATLKNMQKIFPGKEVCSIFPFASREVRYQEAIQYNFNKSHSCTHIKELAETYVIPRFLNDRGELTEPNKPFALSSFSIGGREIMMVENYLRQTFQEQYKCDMGDVKALFSYLQGFCVGYAFDFDALPSPSFPKVIIFSMDDVGVLRPNCLSWQILCNEKYHHGVNIFQTGDEDMPTYLILLGHDIVPLQNEDGKVSHNGHSLSHYTEAIMDLPEELQDLLGDFGCG